MTEHSMPKLPFQGVRYQHCRWYVKLYRRLRYQVPSWFWFLRALVWWSCTDDEDADGMTIKDLWHVSVGRWQADASWVYTIEEMYKRLGIKEPENG